jgi:hypothetical protein
MYSAFFIVSGDIPSKNITIHSLFSASRDPVQSPTDQTGPDRTGPDRTRPDQTRPDQTRPDQTRPDQTRPDQTRPDQTKYPCIYPHLLSVLHNQRQWTSLKQTPNQEMPYKAKPNPTERAESNRQKHTTSSNLHKPKPSKPRQVLVKPSQAELSKLARF